MDHLLVLERERIRQTQQQDAGADDPEGFAAEGDGFGGAVVGGGEGAGEFCAGLRRDDVAEGGEAVGEGFVGGRVGEGF